MTEEHQALNFTISSPGWGLLMQQLGKEQSAYVKQLLDPSLARASRMSDDYIRGYVQGMIYAATWPRLELKAADDAELAENKLVDDGGRHEHIVQYGYTAGIDSPRLEE